MLEERPLAVVTGAGRGLGSAVAEAFAVAGYRVALLDITVDELTSTEARIARGGHSARAFRADIADPHAVETVASEILATFGTPRVLVNAAAILDLRSFAATSFAEWQQTLAVNLSGPWLCTKAFLPAMLTAARGSIINVTSRAGIEPFRDETAYCAAKFGLEGFTRSLALELDGSGVAINLITPGIGIKPTSLSNAAFAAMPPETRARYADPALLTPAFLHLATADERGVNGQRSDAYTLSAELRASAVPKAPHRSISGDKAEGR